MEILSQNREKILEDFEYAVRKSHGEGWDYVDGLTTEDGFKILQLLKEQEDDYKNILSDYEDLAREHEKLLDKKIPLITNGQEIIRCKDCKKQGSYDCHITSLTGQTSSDDWFCADGERRNDDA